MNGIIEHKTGDDSGWRGIGLAITNLKDFKIFYQNANNRVTKKMFEVYCRSLNPEVLPILKFLLEELKAREKTSTVSVWNCALIQAAGSIFYKQLVPDIVEHAPFVKARHTILPIKLWVGVHNNYDTYPLKLVNYLKDQGISLNFSKSNYISFLKNPDLTQKEYNDFCDFAVTCMPESVPNSYMFHSFIEEFISQRSNINVKDPVILKDVYKRFFVNEITGADATDKEICNRTRFCYICRMASIKVPAKDIRREILNYALFDSDFAPIFDEKAMSSACRSHYMPDGWIQENCNKHDVIARASIKNKFVSDRLFESLEVA